MVGTLPAEIGLLSHLKILQLTFNRGMVGAIPESIGNLTRLERFYAWNTSFTSIPTAMGNMKNLIALDLTDNCLEGELPEGLSDLTKVDTVYLDGNPKLTCPLTSRMSNWLKNVTFFQLSSN